MFVAKENLVDLLALPLKLVLHAPKNLAGKTEQDSLKRLS